MKSSKIKVLFLSTYPPRECGIATFTQDILRELKKDETVVPQVVAISRGGETYDDDVAFDIRQDVQQDYLLAAEAINTSEAALLVVEHEYGIFGGKDGCFLLDLLKQLKIPYIVTCHTVLPHPSAGQLQQLAEACKGAVGVVAMSKLSRCLLAERYGMEEDKISVIHHGVPAYQQHDRFKLKQKEGLDGHFVVSTFGLLSPGKGLEHGIEAIARVAWRHPQVRYLILGQTHPVVKQQEGEAYRYALCRLAQQLGVEKEVIFVDRYLYKPDIVHYLTLSDVYLTPYLSRDQAVSGTLAYAIGCGRVVVSTPYLYAREMLDKGRGLLADFANPEAMATCIRRVIENPEEKRRMEENTLRLGKTMVWPQVVQQYARLFVRVAQQAKGLAS